VIGLEGATGRGSVRGPQGFPLYDALSACRADLVGFGGHQAAAGVHVRSDRLDALRASWHSACQTLAASCTSQPREILVRLDRRDDPMAVIADFDRFEPFGEGNPPPLVYVDEVMVRGARNLKGHLKLELVRDGVAFSAIGFSMGELAPSMPGRTASIVGALRRNTFAGGPELQIRSIDPGRTG
jgi:single-stranded-DNA-specific exonuclease